jgi:hypothetical protein
MALTNSYIQVYGQLPQLFKRISDGQAPEKFTRQHLKDLGFASSNFNAVIPLLKALGFLSSEGVPTQRYLDYRDASQSRKIMANAVRDAYGDLFTIKAHPTSADRNLIEGKFKSSHNATPNTAKLMASTFFALLDLADLSTQAPTELEKKKEIHLPNPPVEKIVKSEHKQEKPSPTLHYNIQIHLPATKDIEVFGAIFKALREHLLD